MIHYNYICVNWKKKKKVGVSKISVSEIQCLYKNFFINMTQYDG